MFLHLITALQPWWRVLHLAALLTGLALIVIALLSVVKQGKSHNGGGLGAAAMAFLAGVFLLNLYRMLDAISLSTFGNTSAHGLLAYTGGSIGGVSAPIIGFAINIIQVVGLYGVIRGFVLLSRSGQDPRTFGPAMTHIVGGVFAVNIVSFLHILGATVGSGLQSAITRIF
jgi:hypothetical protein